MSTFKMSNNDIIWAYNTFLKRKPENEETVHYLKSKYNLKQLIELLINCSEYKNQIASEFDAFPAGHFYSPIPSNEDRNIVYNHSNELVHQINLNIDTQLSNLYKFSEISKQLDFLSYNSLPHRYCSNSQFNLADATTLAAMMLLHRPKKIIEVGCGFSSAVMMDINDLFFNGKIDFLFIDPYPERLYSVMSNKDLKQYSVVEKKIQDFDFNQCKLLNKNDFLFVDSSHVIKYASDLHTIFFNIIPTLNYEVYVHLHDIFWPFEYPHQWILEGRSWNENYLLRSLLMQNTSLAIEFFVHYLFSMHHSILCKYLPTHEVSGSSIWLKSKLLK